MTEGIQRRLAAIMATDVVGYSRLMGEDEAGTLGNLKAVQSELLQPKIAAHNGRVVKLLGDGMLAEFPSVVEAVKCGIEIQQALEDREAEKPDENRITLRIGVHLGDIIVDGTDIYGDGVNLAARLERIAAPGGICVTSIVHQSLGKKTGSLFADAGHQKLKNIERPVHVYRWPADLALSEAFPQSNNRYGPRKTLMVPPLKFAGDDDAGFLAEGLREGLLNNLNKQTAIDVIRDRQASETQAAFVLEGSVRARGERIRLAFSLVETSNNRQIWSEQYDRSSGDVFELEDEVSRIVSAVVRVRLKDAQFDRLRNTKDEQLAVEDLLDKAAAFFTHGPGENKTVEATLRVALSREPDNSMANAMLAFCLYREFEFSPMDLSDEDKKVIDRLAEKAVMLQADNYFAHFIVSLVAQDLHGMFERAKLHAEAALQVNPEFLPAQGMVSIAECHIGDLESGITSLMQVSDTDRQDPHRPRYQRELALAHFMRDDIETAAGLLEQLVEFEPSFDRNRLIHSAVLATRGEITNAQSIVSGLHRNYPDLSLANKRMTWIGRADAADKFEDAMAVCFGEAS